MAYMIWAPSYHPNLFATLPASSPHSATLACLLFLRHYKHIPSKALALAVSPARQEIPQAFGWLLLPIISVSA